jgi:hypothetical protein
MLASSINFPFLKLPSPRPDVFTILTLKQHYYVLHASKGMTEIFSLLFLLDLELNQIAPSKVN